MENTKETLVFASVCSVIISLAAYLLFGFAGVGVFVAVILMVLPFFILLKNFSFNDGERVIFSFMMGFSVFPSLVYILGFFVSFRLSIFIVFLLIILASFLLGKIRNYSLRKKNSPKADISTGKTNM